MMNVKKEEKRKVTKWIIKHKKERALSGLSVATIIIILLSKKNNDELKTYLVKTKLQNNYGLDKRIISKEVRVNVETSIAQVMSKNIEKPTFNVESHLRELPKGFNHSIEKELEALKLGIELKPNQTLVNAYIKGNKVA